MKKPMTAEEIAQSVINVRFPKEENNRVSDFELYHSVIELTNKLLKHHLEKFTDECVNECIFEDEYKLANKIDQTLIDYLTKNNI